MLSRPGFSTFAGFWAAAVVLRTCCASFIRSLPWHPHPLHERSLCTNEIDRLLSKAFQVYRWIITSRNY